LGLSKVEQNIYVCGFGLFTYLTYDHFWKKLLDDILLTL